MMLLPLVLILHYILNPIAAYGFIKQPCLKNCGFLPYINPMRFVPAQPGQTPICAQPGLTFCEALDVYPQQIIKQLIDVRPEDLRGFIRDESLEEFHAYRKTPDYDSDDGYHYPKPKVPAQLYPSTTPTYLHDARFNGSLNRYLPPHNSNSFLPPNVQINPEAFNYQTKSRVRPMYHATHMYDPNEAQWVNRNRRGAARVDVPNGRTRRVNPLYEYSSRSSRSRRKRQTNDNSVSVCPTRTMFVTPKAALNNQGNWMFVVNLRDKDDITQQVKSELCTTDQCDGLCSLPLGYTSKCEQRYVQKRLVALDGTGNRLYTDVFWFPHGCSCQLSLNDY